MGLMKTTIELPDDILRRAKVAAAERDTSLKDLFTQALENFLIPPSRQGEDQSLQQLLQKMKASNTEPMKPLSREDLHER